MIPLTTIPLSVFQNGLNFSQLNNFKLARINSRLKKIYSFIFHSVISCRALKLEEVENKLQKGKKLAENRKNKLYPRKSNFKPSRQTAFIIFH